MKDCSQVQNLERWSKDKPLSPSVRAHLEECADCRNRIRQWDDVESTLQEIFYYSDTGDNTSRVAAAEALMAKVRHNGTNWGARLFFRPVWVAVAVAIVLLSIGVVFYASFAEKESASRKTSRSLPLFVADVNGNRSGAKTVSGDGYRVPASKSARQILSIENDRVGIDTGAEVVVARAEKAEVLLALVSGKIACDVSKRRGDERFAVESGKVRVEVVGTRFSVSSYGTDHSVAVFEGVVQVFVKDKMWRVSAGDVIQVSDTGRGERQKLTTKEADEIDRLLNTQGDEPSVSADESVEPSDVEDQTTAKSNERYSESDEHTGSKTGKDYRRGAKGDLTSFQNWILEGEFSKARSGLTDHLETVPTDSRAWLLLADCERKSGQWHASVQAYRKVMRYSSGAAQRRAAYRAASILQDELNEHREAISLFEDYLAVASLQDAVRPEAMIRMARSYLQIGNQKEAERLLKQVAFEYNGTSAAVRARKMLRDN
ncbi:MAG: FecR domain-containing protein [Deltaproteobacteria bacterium]|nr:FecR domain-containing protein [Deltaproteobacteria bacterium]MBN2671124.1 FecR domain-containing protein [Deltaproteobacteria bacterium]